LEIEYSSRFKKDYRREIKDSQNSDLPTLLTDVLGFLTTQQFLPASYKEHPLIGNWVGYFECHLKPDLLLIYKVIDGEVVKLIRLGSHSDLF